MTIAGFSHYSDGSGNSQASQLQALLDDLTGIASEMEFPSADNGHKFGVWVDGELIGAGDSRDEAYEDAVRTVRAWESLARGDNPYRMVSR